MLFWHLTIVALDWWMLSGYMICYSQKRRKLVIAQSKALNAMPYHLDIISCISQTLSIYTQSHVHLWKVSSCLYKEHITLCGHFFAFQIYIHWDASAILNASKCFSKLMSFVSTSCAELSSSQQRPTISLAKCHTPDLQDGNLLLWESTQQDLLTQYSVWPQEVLSSMIRLTLSVCKDRPKRALNQQEQVTRMIYIYNKSYCSKSIARIEDSNRSISLTILPIWVHQSVTECLRAVVNNTPEIKYVEACNTRTASDISNAT